MPVEHEARKPRRHVGSIVTEDSIQKMVTRLNQHFTLVERKCRIPVADRDGDEKFKARLAILQRAANRVMLGAAVYLGEKEPKIFSSILLASSHWADDMMMLGKAEFRVPRPSQDRKFYEWFFGPSIVGSHREIVRRLKAVWSAPLPSWRIVRNTPVSRKGRYDTPQRIGTERRRWQLNQRVQLVMQIASELHNEEAIVDPVSEKLARKWVGLWDTPAKLSIQILGYFMKRTPRQTTTMLNTARKQIKERAEQDAYDKLVQS